MHQRSRRTLPILAIHRVIPHPLVHLHHHEPGEQQVVLELLDQHSLAAYRIEDLQQHRSQPSLWSASRHPRTGDGRHFVSLKLDAIGHHAWASGFILRE